MFADQIRQSVFSGFTTGVYRDAKRQPRVVWTEGQVYGNLATAWIRDYELQNALDERCM